MEVNFCNSFFLDAALMANTKSSLENWDASRTLDAPPLEAVEEVPRGPRTRPRPGSQHHDIPGWTEPECRYHGGLSWALTFFVSLWPANGTVTELKVNRWPRVASKVSLGLWEGTWRCLEEVQQSRPHGITVFCQLGESWWMATRCLVSPPLGLSPA